VALSANARVAVCTAHGAHEVGGGGGGGGGGGQNGGVFVAGTLLLSFLVTFHVCPLNTFFHRPSPAGMITQHIPNCLDQFLML